jgi:flagellar assembly factor FliW
MNIQEAIEPERQNRNGDNIVQLPYGLLGFEQVKNYALVARPHEEPFLWLQMLDEGRCAFLVISPSFVVPDYQPDIAEEDVRFLELTTRADAVLFNIVTLRAKGPATINLKGPVVINCQTSVGKQVIPINATEYSLHHPLPVS